MPRQVAQEAFTTFVGGLNTEAGKLTFPKDASVDELNCLLERSGSRRRRLGIEYESSYSLSSDTYGSGAFSQIFIWENVGGQAGKQFIVVQIGSILRFYDNSSLPLSEQEVNTTLSSSTLYTVDLSTYAVSGGSPSTEPVDAVSVNGALVVVGPSINPFYIERDITDGSFTETQITFRIRDYEWLGDRSSYDEQVSTTSLSNARKYDTYNCGWEGGDKDVATNALTTYEASESAYPPLTHPWFSGKNSSGDFSVSEFQKVYAGTSRLTNGHFIYNLFDIDRESKSSITGVTNYTETSRFTTVEGYAGRVFYSGMSSSKNSSKIFFSQVLEDMAAQIGELLQINDPTSEYLSDLLDTDGGFLAIPEAQNIKKLHVFGPRLLVFAENGVWSISGVDDVFRATEYSVSKISEIGLDNVGSFISAGGRPYWWSFNGIHTLIVSEQGVLEERNLSQNTIQTMWNEITPTQRDNISATYDSLNSKLFWFYPSKDETVSNKYNEVLIYDEVLNAFYPWRISDKSADTPYVIGAIYIKNAGQGLVSHNVVDSLGNQVIDSLGNNVVAFIEGRTDTGTSDVKLLAYDPSGSITFAEFSNTEFYDWGTEDYSSYAEAGFNFQGDMISFKTSPYIIVYLERTETGWTGDEINGYEPVRPSSCLVSSYIDFKDTPSSNPQQAYRYKYPLVVDETSLTSFDYPQEVVATRLKLRGRGRSYRLRFESEAGKDFNLLGWEVVGLKNGNL